MVLPPSADLYPHRATRYRSAETIAASGEVGAPTLSSTVTGILCYFQTGESVKAPEGFVLSEQDNLFTLDIWHVPDDTDVQSGDVIKQTTGPQAGQYWVARGDDQIRSQFAQKIRVRLAREPNPPAWVP